MLSGSKGADQQEAAKKVLPFFPNQGDRGTHMNISGKVERVEELKKKIEKLQEEQTGKKGKELKILLERVVKKRKLLKEQEAKLKRMKGRPVALKKFLEEVVLPGCVLCSP